MSNSIVKINRCEGCSGLGAHIHYNEAITLIEEDRDSVEFAQVDGIANFDPILSGKVYRTDMYAHKCPDCSFQLLMRNFRESVESSAGEIISDDHYLMSFCRCGNIFVALSLF